MGGLTVPDESLLSRSHPATPAQQEADRMQAAVNAVQMG